MQDLPNYVVINDETQPDSRKQVLRTPAEHVVFPMDEENRQILAILEAKYAQEENCAGLAAPQIGFNKKMLIFAAPDDPLLKQWRKEFTQTMPKTTWINASYLPIGDEQYDDYEGCFSVHDLAGTVSRYKKISYKAQLPNGEHVSGVAEGFLARVIQHEIDHTEGRLFIDYVEKDKLFSIKEYCQKRSKAMQEKDADVDSKRM